MASFRAHIFSLTAANKSTEYHLPFSPQHLTTIDIFYVVFLIILKHAASIFRLSAPLIPSSDPHNSKKSTFDLPSLTLSAPLKISHEDLQRWQTAVGSDPDDLHSPLLPAALTTPLLLLLLAHHKSPILPLGAVNTRNRFNFLDLDACRSLTLSSPSRYLAIAHFGGPDRPGTRVRRGMVFDVVIEIIDTSPEDKSKVIFSQVVTTLQFLPTNAKPLPVNANPRGLDTTAVMDTQREVEMEWDAPDKWAAVCKDYNPIHVYGWAAKAFGFPSKIAHGNHVVARVVEAMRRGVEPVGKFTGDDLVRKTWWEPLAPGSRRHTILEVEFKKPIILPAKVTVKVEKTSRSGKRVLLFQVLRGDNVHIQCFAKST